MSDLDSLLNALAEVLADKVAARLRQQNNGTGAAAVVDAEDRLLKVAEAAVRLGVTPRWLYAHASDFPFTVRLPGRRLRFREGGLTAYLMRHRP